MQVIKNVQYLKSDFKEKRKERKKEKLNKKRNREQATAVKLSAKIKMLFENYKSCNRGVFRIQSNIYDKAFYVFS